MTHNGQKYPFPFHIFTYIFENKRLFLLQNNECIFFQNEVKNNNERLYIFFLNLAFKRSFNQITLVITIKKCIIYV